MRKPYETQQLDTRLMRLVGIMTLTTLGYTDFQSKSLHKMYVNDLSYHLEGKSK